MNALMLHRSLPLLLFVFAALLSSCGSSKNKSQSGSGAYASYSSDGHYNPYPTEPGYVKPTYQEYTEAPPPPPESKPKPTSKSSGSKSSGTTASTSSKSKSKKPTTTASSSSSKSKSKSKSKGATTKSAGSGTLHVVKPKDSLYSLAKKYHTTVSKLKSANGLSSDLIRDGQKLKIP